MNQKIMCHFELMVNDKYFQLSFEPGRSQYDFDDFDKALGMFKEQLDILKQQTIAALDKAEKESESKATEEVPSETVDGTIVS